MASDIGQEAMKMEIIKSNRKSRQRRFRFATCYGLVVLASLAAGRPSFAQRPTDRDRAAQTDEQRDPLDDILSQLDPSIINMTGAELDIEVIGDQLILRGNQTDLDMVELLVTMLEQTTERKELRIVTVTEKDANDIASSLESALQDILGLPNERPEQQLSITALSTRILMVSALPEHLDFIVALIKQIDGTKEGLPDPEQLVFHIKHRRASDVAEQLIEIIGKIQEKQGAEGAKSEIQIIPNNANNSIMVLAPETERIKIQKIIDEIDVAPVPGWGEVKLTLFPLLHSKASEMTSLLTELLTSQQDREAAEEVIYRMLISKALPSGEIVDLAPIDLQKPTQILADEGTNSLIVATVEENVGPIGELIRLLDGVPMAEEIELRLFPLRFADAESIAGLLEEMVGEGQQLTEDPDGSGQGGVPEGALGKALVYNVGIFSDVRTNTIIITGRSEHLQLVSKIIDELDRPATALKFPLKFITLEHTDATSIGDIITQLFDQRFQAAEAIEAGNAALERERVFLMVDVRSNSLIVSASEENFAEITTIATQLDTKPAKLFDQIRLVHCTRLDADDLKEKIDELWQRKAELRREEDIQMNLPVIVVDQRSNTLLIASRLEDYEEIQRLVDTLESQPLIDDIKLFELRYADAAMLSGMLDQLFEGVASRIESFEAPTILPDPRSNAVVVAGSRDALERVAELLERLDVEAGPLTAMFKVYPLQHTSSAQLAPRMQELFDSRSEGTDIEGTPIVILAEESSNSLVCSASRDDHEIIVELLTLLDKPSNLAHQVEIFPLKMARAASVAETLESLFTSQAEGGSGRMDAIATQADERTNSIIVWASPSQMVNIGEVIARLDTATPAVEMMVKVIQLKQALASDFAELLQAAVLEGEGDDERAIILSFMETGEDGVRRVRKLLRQGIKIEADPRTNSLFVMAPPDSIDMLEAMIRDFDLIRPIRSELRLFPLMNADAEAMVEQLTELFEPQGGGDGEVASKIVFGGVEGDFDVASVGQDLRFTADSRTNTLIAAGAEVDLRMVEELVQFLDAQRVDDRIVEVIQTKYVDPSEIASAITGFNSQEQEVIGEIDTEEAAARRMERQISIEAVGTDGEGSSSLIVGMDRRMYTQTMEMIQELDRPEPQVMISVLIAEVSLSDSLEFGMEIAGQSLDFSLGAIQGPNGIVRGSDFDFVAGTTLGVVGSSLGFNFTVTGEDLSFLFHALQQESRLEVLSRPVLLISNGQEGNITIADQVPFVESSQINDTGSTNSVIGRENVGIVLTAVPHISPDGYVTIELTQEISNFSGENLQLTEGVTSPIFSTRELTTNVTIRDGETVVIGGLITSRKSEGSNSIPVLGELFGDIPVFGGLFKSTNISETKTELLIIMTVDVVRTAEDAYRMSVEQRDKFVLPDSIRQSPLMEGLRILPDQNLLGPNGKQETPAPREAPHRERKLYGPKPKTYGPTINLPSKLTNTGTKKPVYGPRLARINATEPGS